MRGGTFTRALVAALSAARPPVPVHSFSARALAPTTVGRDGPRRAAPAPGQRSALRMSAAPFHYGQRPAARAGVRLPLLVDLVRGGAGPPQHAVPLPHAHLPPELGTVSLCELEVDVPLHRMLMRDAVAAAGSPESSRCYGHVTHSPNDDAHDLVGSVGCVGEILICAPSATRPGGEAPAADDETGPLSVLARGAFRFRVREVLKSIPYPVAIVDELLDDAVQDDTNEGATEGDDEEGDIYETLSATELIKQIFRGLEKILNGQVEAAASPLSPLERQILEDAPSSAPLEIALQRRAHAEESVAVFQAFTSSLLDIAPEERERRYAVAMMAGELGNLSAGVRVEMLATTDGAARLRLVLRELSAILALDSARKITKSLSLGGGGGEGGDVNAIDGDRLRAAEDAHKQLRVGAPALPPWAGQLKAGVRVDYFWNEDEGWCAGTVAADPVRIVDEVVVTVAFDDDGSVHRLPLRGDDKARWRPPLGGAFD